MQRTGQVAFHVGTRRNYHGQVDMQPEVLLLDEPFAGLDEPDVQRVMHILDQLPQTLLLVSHHRDWLRQLASRIARLDHGQLRED